MKVSIKESKELLAAIQLLAVAGVEIAKDGLGADDLPKALTLLSQSEVLVEGVKGLSQVDEEMKDLDQAELLELGAAAYVLVKAVIAASKKKVEV